MRGHPHPDAQVYVYRVYDADDLLLYVGCSADVPARLRAHAALQPWGPDIARHSIEGPFRRIEGLRRERSAIHTGWPLYNIQHNRMPNPGRCLVAHIAYRTSLPPVMVRQAMADGLLPLRDVTDKDINDWFMSFPTSRPHAQPA